MIRWQKIKVTKEAKILLEYCESRPGNKWDDHMFQCSDPAREEFYNAFKALAEFVVEMCELPEEDLDLKKITVRGVSFSYGGDREVMGATLSAARKLEYSNSPLSLVTPHKPSESYSEGQERDVNGMLTDECLDALKVLQAEALLYLGGTRAQVDLFAEADANKDQVEAVK